MSEPVAFTRDAFYDDVGDRMRLWRKRMGETQEDVASMLDMPRSTYANIERGGQRAPVDVLWRLALHYGIDVGDFLPDRPGSVDLPDSSGDGLHGIVAERTEVPDGLVNSTQNTPYHA